LKERKVELGDFLADTTEVAASEGRQAVVEPMDIDEVEDEEASDGEQGPLVEKVSQFSFSSIAGRR